MKKTLFTLLLLVSAFLAASAQQYDYLTLRAADGTERSWSLDGLKIVVSGGEFRITAPGSALTLPATSLAALFFSATPTGISGTEAGPDVRIEGGRLIVSGPSGAKVVVRTPDGRVANPEALQPGLYLVTVNGKTRKLMSR